MNEYSSLKIFHHQDKIDVLRVGGQPVPAQVQLIISDLCNQDCSFCAYRMSGYTTNQLFTIGSELAKVGTNNPKRFIPYEKVIEILDDFVELGIRAVQLTGGGEPSIHPRFVDIVKDIIDRDLEFSLVTNGYKLKNFGDLVKAKWLRVSVDAGNEFTYAKVRRVSEGVFSKVWDNIKNLAFINEDCTLGVGFVVTNENWNELLECCELAKESGVSNLRISAVFQNEDERYFDEFYDKVKELILICKYRYEDASFKVIDLFGDRVSDLEVKSPHYSFCGYQHFCSYIGGDLNVYRCCNTAYNKQGLVGSLKEMRFKDFWLSESKKEKYENFDAKTCARCQFNSKNETILYALDPNPTHVNFV